MRSITTLPAKGVYTLLIFVPEEICLNVGSLGMQRFPKGYYAYTGSALGRGASSLNIRVQRHSRKAKTKFWHIDYLLAHEDVLITSVLTAQTDENMECETNSRIKHGLDAEILIEGFGSSDCRQNCRSHLLFLGEKNVKEGITKTYTEKFGSEYVVQLQLMQYSHSK